MRTTYLVKKADADELVAVSGQEWYEITKNNDALSDDQKRYFIKDVIVEGAELDILVVEVTGQEYKTWHTEQMAKWRNNTAAKDYSVHSLDAPFQEDLSLQTIEAVDGFPSAEKVTLGQMALHNLILALSAWKPWAVDLLKKYLQGDRRTCTSWLADQCGISLQAARKYKREFEKFVKIFLS